jgi:predicted O-methyltransferase YrrM
MRTPAARRTVSSVFRAVQGSLGVSITPSHFYFPVPSLKSFRDKDWTACRQLPAIDFRFPEQIELLKTVILPYASEWKFSEDHNLDHREFHFSNGFFERVDGEVAYSLVRSRHPRRIIEIGSGNSTLLFAAAVRRNQEEGFPCELISIEPYPAPYLRTNNLSRLIDQPVQQVSLDLFRSLGPSDILFVDSSHVVSMDSDVLFEMLRILPELQQGVLVHFHDIFTPHDYPEKFVMTNLCFWGEQYMLESFLSFNSAFRVVWAGSAMQAKHADLLREAFPGWEGSFTRMCPQHKIFAPSLDGKNVWPCSFWIERFAPKPTELAQ